jgi:enterochelin esterase-like enzyme
MPSYDSPWPFQTLWVQSELLRDNPAGAPTHRRMHVYVPPQYASEPERRFSVAYYLAGWSGWGGMKLAAEKAWEEPLPAQLDRLMTAGELEPTIVAFPDCFTAMGGTQYRNSPATGRWADHVCDELVPALDQAYRTLQGRAHRGVMGKSSGGYGALVLGMTRPELFGLVCSTAGDSYFELTLPADLGKAFQVFRKAGGPVAFLRQFEGKRQKASADLSALMVLCYAQCYSPNLEVPDIRADLPLDLETGAFRDDVWQRWLACDPVRMAEQHVEALRSLRLLFLDAGTSDEWCLDVGQRRLASRLKELGVAHQTEEFDGGHLNIDWRIEASLRRMTGVWRELG